MLAIRPEPTQPHDRLAWRGGLRAMVLVAVSLLTSTAAALCYELPFPNPNLSDGFGSTCCGRSNPHRGVDFAQATGTRIPAVANGTVRVKTYSSCLGHVVVLRHPDGMYSGYAHMREASPLRIGQQVTIGTTVGRVGNTGTCTTGPHLHLTISNHEAGWGSGSVVDPYRYIRNHGRSDEMCNDQDDDCDGDVDEPLVCEMEVIHESVTTYAPPTTTDVNGDGRLDVCAMLSDGFHCWPANGAGWDDSWSPIPMLGSDGWSDRTNYATTRMGDIDGNGYADLCARSDQGMVCATSDGTGFGELTLWNDVPTDENGWDRARQYSTLRLADVNGDLLDDLCGRTGEAFECWLSDGSSFATLFAGPAMTGDGGWNAPNQYGTIRMGDLNGDGRADLCARGGEGVTCWLAGDEGFETEIAGPAWRSENGWDQLHRWTTIRLADFDGDGNDDLCGRLAGEYRCFRSLGTALDDEPVHVENLANDNGWSNMDRLVTLRVADVDGDGSDDIVARGGINARAWVWRDGEFTKLIGPEWTHVDEWPNTRGRINTLRMADVDGDGRDDICGRDPDGWRCSLDFESGEPLLMTGDFLHQDDVGNHERYWTTILSGGTSCVDRVEQCNGRDDDCDDGVDEGCPSDTPDAGTTPAADGGTPSMPSDDGPDGLDSGCGCRVVSPTDGSSALTGLALLTLTLVRRRRR
ncbi:MAG: VCBS repeat domain-containing M23 family metallopeptidase [Deltaproteobacteria bacterium]|nr:VCBS repeat domain-containing M23 family metallopeptidase [Deltaproteobacteria bacterium]